MVSFVTVTELRYGALKAGWGDLRRRGLERDLARLVIGPADDELICWAIRCDTDRWTCDLSARQASSVFVASSRRACRRRSSGRATRSGSRAKTCLDSMMSFRSATRIVSP